MTLFRDQSESFNEASVRATRERMDQLRLPARFPGQAGLAMSIDEWQRLASALDVLTGFAKTHGTDHGRQNGHDAAAAVLAARDAARFQLDVANLLLCDRMNKGALG